MPALRILGLVILSVFAVSIGIFGYFFIRGAMDESAARGAALQVVEACGTAISTGSTQNVSISIPGNYHMRFLDNQIFIDNQALPQGGLIFRFSDDSPDLGPGSYVLSISLQGDRLVVARI